MWVFLVSLSAWAQLAPVCATPTEAPYFLEIDVRPPPAPPTSELVDRENNPDVPNRMYSDHFALKWGNSNPLSTEEAERWLNDFEDMLVIMRDDWGMNDPTGTGGTYFNVYLGDSGNSVPSVNGAAAYFTLTDDGYPYIVLSNILRDDPIYARAVIAHEFFHAAQWAEEAYFDWDLSAWYWEATATWAMGEIVAEDSSGASFLPFYAMQPQAGLYHHGSGEHGGAPPDAHQYGAFIFPQYISEKLQKPDAIIESWINGDFYGDPIEHLRQSLSPSVLEDALVGHASHMIGWDYEDGDLYAQYMDRGVEVFPEHDRQIAELETIDNDWFMVDDTDAPAACGYNTIEIPDGWLNGNRLTVSLESASEGDASFRAQVVSLAGDELEYHTLDHSQPYDSVTVDPDAYLWLVVANVSTITESPDPAPYRVSFVSRGDADAPEEEEQEEEDNPTEDTSPETQEDTREDEHSSSSGEYRPIGLAAIDEPPPKSGGCSHTPGRTSSALWLIGLTAMLGLRRRRTE